MRVGEAEDVCAGDSIFVETLLATSSHHEEKRRSKLRLYG
jgi:hypothetical protein